MKKFIIVVVTFVLLSVSLFSLSASAAVNSTTDYQDVFPTAFAVSNQKEIVKMKYKTLYNVSVVLDDGTGMIVTTNPETYATIKTSERLEVNLATKTVVVRSDAADALKTIMKNGKKYFAVFNDGTMEEITIESPYNFQIGMSHEDVMRESRTAKGNSIGLLVVILFIPGIVLIWILSVVIRGLVTKVAYRSRTTSDYDEHYYDYYDHY